jgi:hypothetical protein
MPRPRGKNLPTPPRTSGQKRRIPGAPAPSHDPGPQTRPKTVRRDPFAEAAHLRAETGGGGNHVPASVLRSAASVRRRTPRHGGDARAARDDPRRGRLLVPAPRQTRAAAGRWAACRAFPRRGLAQWTGLLRRSPIGVGNCGAGEGPLGSALLGRLVREETPVRWPAQTTAPARRWRRAGAAHAKCPRRGPPPQRWRASSLRAISGQLGADVLRRLRFVPVHRAAHRVASRRCACGWSCGLRKPAIRPGVDRPAGITGGACPAMMAGLLPWIVPTHPLEPADVLRLLFRARPSRRLPTVSPRVYGAGPGDSL